MVEFNISNDYTLLYSIFGKDLFKENNFFFFEDFEVVSKENSQMFVEMFKLENRVDILVEFGYFTVINEKFLLIIDDFKKLLKNIFLKFIIPNRNQFIKQKNHAQLFILFNSILVFSPEFTTIYNIKKEIINHLCKEKEFKGLNDLLISEFIFTNLINKKFRKSCVSWNYRKFLAELIYEKSRINECCISIEKAKLLAFDELNKKFQLKNKTLIQIFSVKSFEIILSNPFCKFLKFDMLLLDEINDFSNRNYYLWNYLIFLYKNYIKNNDLFHKEFFIFIFSVIVQNQKDYSAYSFLVNHSVELHFDKGVVSKLVEYLKMLLKPLNEEKSYIQAVISIFQK